MYRLNIPKKNKDVIDIMDALIYSKEVEITNPQISRVLGKYTKKWKSDGILSLQKKTFIKLNITGVERNIKCGGKKIEYILNVDDYLLKKLKL